ncbi:MAG TPA: Na+ dependent nucleoside transporter N-terminal domain-containing protein, partial [Burkholderiales bacterium]
MALDNALHALAGMTGLLALAWLASEARRRVPWALVARALLLLLVLAVVALKLPLVKEAVLALNQALLALEKATQAGTGFVFGYLGGGPAPFEARDPGGLFILAFRALP